MYHDAPVEAAVAVHRHRNRPSAATVAAREASQRIIEDYQLHRVADFLFTGRDAASSSSSAKASTFPPAEAIKGETEVAETTSVSNKCSAGGCCGGCAASGVTTATGGAAPYVRVALQFPDELLHDAVAVVSALQDILTSDPRYADAMRAKHGPDAVPSSSNGTLSAAAAPRPAASGAVSARPPAMDNPHRPIGVVRLFVLADNTFGSCCPDEITAQHYTTDCIVHFGDACMSRSTRLPVLYVQPAFHFDAITAAPAAQQQQQEKESPSLLHSEASVVVDLVERVAAALHQRVESWWKEEGLSSFQDTGKVALRLTVVGTYPTRLAIQAAEQRWSKAKMKGNAGEQSAAAVTVDWPRYEERNGITPVQNHDCTTDAKGSSDAAAHSPSSAVEDEDWLVNGVRFRRLRTSSGPCQEVQYFLFFGAAGSAALVHVLTAQQYNDFHYTDACRSLLEWDSGEEATTVPVVSVVNNTFGVDSDSGDAELAALQSASASASSSSPVLPEHATAQVDARVKAWLSAVLSDGVSALLTGDYVVAQQALQRRVRQRAFNIESVRASTAIGVLVASLAIEGYYELTQQLHQLIRAYGKRSYVIYVGHLNEFKLANFVDTVDCFVAVACPYSRQSHFPEKRDNFMKPIVSPAELLVALTTTDDSEGEALYGMAAVYTTSFETALGVLRNAVRVRKLEMDSRARGDAESEQRRKDEEERWASSGVLVRAGGSGGGVLTVQESSQGALARLYEREYVGLDPRIGQTPIQAEVMEGKHGIARGYAKEREEQHAEPPVSNYK